MKDKIFEILKQYRKALIVAVILVILLIIGFGVIPARRTAKANASPMVGISAKVTKEYKTVNDIDMEDFVVYAIHENGMETKLDGTEYLFLDTSTCLPIGGSSVVCVSYVEEGLAFTCEVTVDIKREPVAGVKCGYPNLDDVTAVLYSNGELAFEGSGSVLAFKEDSVPWLSLDTDIDIIAVSFENSVKPTDMNYWFEGLTSLVYCDTIPSSVKTMIRTFADCASLIEAPEWEDSELLLNITECFSGCTGMTKAGLFPESVRVAAGAYSNCTSLVNAPDLSEAYSLTDAKSMFEGCDNLATASVGPVVQDLSRMYSGCINLKEMPEIPETAKDTSAMFSGDISLEFLTAIPSGVTSVSEMFCDCQIISGELVVDCNAENCSNMFSGAALATIVNLTGSSLYLDPYANTCESGNVLVNGNEPNEELVTVKDVAS